MMSVVCALCELASEDTECLVQKEQYRVVLVKDANYPGFCRVIWQQHIREMTDLSPKDRQLCMEAVWLVEQSIRQIMQPHKVNIASLGNMVPHLHWHIIPRFTEDAHFPQPIWAATEKHHFELASHVERKQALLPHLKQHIQIAFSQCT